MEELIAADECNIDNTGNICIWPCEEVLCWICVQQLHLFENNKVLELGAGLSGLVGLFAFLLSVFEVVALPNFQMQNELLFQMVIRWY